MTTPSKPSTAAHAVHPATKPHATATFFLKPQSALLVLDPSTKKPLAAAGETKPRSRYWLRRIADGDVTISTPPAPAK